MNSKYGYKIAKALVWPDLSVEFAAGVINGWVTGSDIWDDVCGLIGGWCNDTAVFLAWDKMGRPDESDYMPADYDLERDPERRRSMVANARISAIADVVADALPAVVDEIIMNEGWRCVPVGEAETDMHGVGWLEEGCGALGVYTESYLVKGEN